MYLKLIACSVLQREFASIAYRCPNTIDITTVRQQVDIIGRLAAEQLLRSLDGEDAPAEPIRVPVELVPRESTRG